MKTLKNQTLLYDADCPLCNLYTNGFIKAGMLDANGRKNFSCLTAEEAGFVDRKRASNEIALIDNDQKKVIYGMDSLLKVIGNSFPIVEKIGKIAAVNFLLRKLYSFVSYNRKVIIPSHIQQPNEIQCIPDFNHKHRIAYLIFGGFVTAYILLLFSKLIPQLPSGNYFDELLLAFGQLAFQALFLRKTGKDKCLDYFGNLITVSLMGSLL